MTKGSSNDLLLFTRPTQQVVCAHVYQTLALYSRPFQSSAPLTLPFSLFCPLCAWLIRAELEFSLRLILLYLLRDYLLTSCDSLKGTVGSASLCGCTHTHAWLYSQSSSITPAKQRTNLHCQITAHRDRWGFISGANTAGLLCCFLPHFLSFLCLNRFLLDSDKPAFQSLMEIQSKCFLWQNTISLHFKHTVIIILLVKD